MRIFLPLLILIGLFFAPLPVLATNLQGMPEQVSPTAPTQLQQRLPGDLQNKNEDIRDIRGPLTSEDGSFLALILSAGALLLIILAGLFLFWKNRRHPPAPPVPAGEAALAELNSIGTLMTVDRTLFYMERISDILRHYIEARFFIPFTRKTSREFLQSLQTTDSTTVSAIRPFLPEMQNCLVICDKAKFSHRLPNHEEMVQVELAIRGFIEKTNPVPNPAGEQ